jgi:3-phosphoshikimate 1-carboxyvinyltransferase
VDTKLDYTNIKSIQGKIVISGSKSESNRLLILQKLFPSIEIKNLSDSDDTRYLKRALYDLSETIDIGHAGTAMRFLTAYLSIQEGKTTILTGSTRMQERPIKILVDALLDLGADISYAKNKAYPPLLINGKKNLSNDVTILGNVSSQYISALLLIAPTLQYGLKIHLKGETTSIPYIQMTLSLLNRIGVKTSFENNLIIVLNHTVKKPVYITVEPDWSSASYFYSLAALQPNAYIELPGFNKKSLQGDSILAEIYKQFGVVTIFTEEGIILKSSLRNSQSSTTNSKQNQSVTLDLKNVPDIAQTIAVTCLGLGINCHLTGLHTLKIKETDRLLALKNELEKLDAKVNITKTSLQLIVPKIIRKNVTIKTYDDHRMAMAFAPLSIKTSLNIENLEIVSKSYPNFWRDYKQLLG